MAERLTRLPRVLKGLEFKSLTGQILHSVANGLPPLQPLYASNCVAFTLCHGDGYRKLVTRFRVMQRV